MKKIVMAAVLLSAIIVSMTASAWAALIYDTGPGNDEGGGWLSSPNQWIGKKVMPSQNYYVNRIDGWMNISYDSVFRVRAYSDTNGDDLPDTILDSWSENLTSTTDSEGNSTPEWKSFDVGISVSGNTNYWVFFETDNGYGTMPDNANPPDALDYYAWQPYSGFFNAGNLDFGLRIYSEQAAVPEPATMMLLGIGAAAMALIRRKRRAA